jgi:hypothetical protein
MIASNSATSNSDTPRLIRENKKELFRVFRCCGFIRSFEKGAHIIRLSKLSMLSKNFNTKEMEFDEVFWLAFKTNNSMVWLWSLQNAIRMQNNILRSAFAFLFCCDHQRRKNPDADLGCL